MKTFFSVFAAILAAALTVYLVVGAVERSKVTSAAKIRSEKIAHARKVLCEEVAQICAEGPNGYSDEAILTLWAIHESHADPTVEEARTAVCLDAIKSGYPAFSGCRSNGHYSDEEIVTLAKGLRIGLVMRALYEADANRGQR